MTFFFSPSNSKRSDKPLLPRNNGTSSQKAAHSFLNPSDPGIVPVKEMMARGTGFGNPRAGSVSPPITNSRNVYLKDFPTYVLAMGDDSGFKFSEEYEVGFWIKVKFHDM